MRSLVLAAAIVLLGFTAGAARDGDREIRITTDESGVVIEDLTGQGRTVVLAGPRVSVPLYEATSLNLVNLDGSGVTGRWNAENERTTFEGSYEVEIRQGEELKARFRVRGATMVIGDFEGSEGWTD